MVPEPPDSSSILISLLTFGSLLYNVASQAACVHHEAKLFWFWYCFGFVLAELYRRSTGMVVGIMQMEHPPPAWSAVISPVLLLVSTIQSDFCEALSSLFLPPLWMKRQTLELKWGEIPL